MIFSSRQLGRIVVLLALCTICPISVNAQSVDECMSAQPSAALQLCKSLIDNGSRNADVYWKLSSAQYQNGQTKLANETLSTALRLYPGDAKLGALKDILTTDTTEQAMISRSAKLNQHSIDRGALKISCLTKSGEVGISACKRRLQLTEQDGDRMRARLAELEETLEASRLATTPTGPVPVQRQVETQEQPQSPPVALLPDMADKELLPPRLEPEPDTQQLMADARREAYKIMVSEVQTSLNVLGFNAGYADGVPGSNTRNALAAFYTAVGAPVITSITDLTMEDIEAEKLKLNRAEEALRESQVALSAGNSSQAEKMLKQARRLSRLLKVPAELEQALQDKQITTAANQLPTRVPTSAQPTVPASTNTGTDTSQRFSELIGKINTLHGRIRRQQANEEQQMRALRGAL